MIVKHSTLIERYLRGIPVLGLVFLFFQSKRYLEMERKNDQAFIETMKELETQPKVSLLNQSVKQEYWLIAISATSVILAWLISYQLLGHLNIVLFCFLRCVMLYV